MEILEKEKCCGCEACVVSCPIKCISMVEDEEGFLYPRIDNTKCIECNNCRNHCPVIRVTQVDMDVFSS